MTQERSEHSDKGFRLLRLGSWMAVLSILAAAAFAGQAGSRWGSLPLGPYTVQNDEWGIYHPGTSTASGSQSIETTGADTWSAHWNWSKDDGRVKSYPSIVRGWNFGPNWTADRGGFPVQVSRRPRLHTSATYSLQGDNQYDVAYDVFVSPRSNPASPSGELMIWLASEGQRPIGSLVATNLAVPGVSGKYDLWRGQGQWPVWTFVAERPTTSVDMDLGAFVRYIAYKKSWLPPAWYVLDIQAGIELIAGNGEIRFTRYSASAE